MISQWSLQAYLLCIGTLKGIYYPFDIQPWDDNGLILNISAQMLGMILDSESNDIFWVLCQAAQRC